MRYVLPGTQCLLFVVGEKLNDSKVQTKPLSQTIEGYLLVPSHLSVEVRKIFRKLSLTAVKVLSRQECPFLRLALEFHQVEIVELILSVSEKPKILRVSVETSNREIIRQLFSSKAFVDKKNYDRSEINNAIDAGSAEFIECLLACKPDHCYRNIRGGTLLHLAALRNNLPLVRSLLKIGTKVDMKRCDGSTPLHIALLKGNFEISSLLLKQCKDINARKNDGSTYLLIAAGKNQANIVRFLLQNGASVEIKNCAGLTPLHAAANAGGADIVSELLWHCKNIDALVKQDQQSSSLLWFAVNNGHLEVAKLLMEHGADVGVQNPEGSTLFKIATEKGYHEIAATILNHWPNSKIKSNKKALCDIVLANHENSNKVTKLMSERGFTISAEDVGNTELLHKAVRENHLEVVAQLLTSGANVNAFYRDCDIKLNEWTKKGESTVLHLAVVYTDRAMIDLLLRHGADVNAVDSIKHTPVHEAISCEWIEVFKLFLESNVNGDRFPEYLRHAAFEGSGTIVKFFMRKGVVPDDRNSPLAAAACKGHLEIVKYLLKRGVGVEGVDEFHESGLRWASRMGFLDITKVLLQYNANIEAKCPEGKTAIFRAAKGGHLEVVRLLLKLGARIDFNDRSGPFAGSALGYAAVSSHVEVFQTLLDYNFTNRRLLRVTEICKYFVPVFIFLAFSPIPNKLQEFKKLSAIISSHLCKMQAAGIYSRQNVNRVCPRLYRLELELYQFKEIYDAEIKNMKTHFIGDSKITFYDVLTKNDNQLARYVRKNTVRQAFYSRGYKTQYPSYASVLEIQFEKGMRRKVLLEESIKAAYVSLRRFSKFSQEVMEQIFDYLRNKDIRWLVEPSVRLQIAEMDCFHHE